MRSGDTRTRHAAFAVTASLAAACGAVPIDGALYNVAPLRAVMNDDVRVLWFGDSFSICATYRVSGASMITWPIGSDFTAASFGEGEQNAAIRTTLLSDGPTQFINAGNSYRLFGSGPEAGLDLRFALPVFSGLEFYAPGASSETVDLASYTTRTLFGDGTVGGFLEPDAPVRIRPIFLQTQTGIPSIPQLYTSDTGSLLIDAAASTTPPGMAGAMGSFQAAADSGRVARFTSSIPPHDERGYTQTLGHVVWETDANGDREPGVYWSTIADGSWTYAGYGRDTAAATGTATKTFSEEQLSHWLAATDLGSAAGNFVFYYLDSEEITYEQSVADIRAMVEQTEAAALAAQIGPVHHTFVVPHNHAIGSDRRIDPQFITQKRDAALEIAMTRGDMSVISIYDATDGVLFDGSPAATEWLTDAGLTTLHYGDRSSQLVGGTIDSNLLDIGRLHPRGTTGAVFYSWIAGRIITDVCPADFAAPYGQLDLADVTAFVQYFVDGSYAVDLAPPYGTIDLEDLQLFVTSFMNGCAEGG